MADTMETISILRLQTTGAESVKDLKENVKALKQILEETKIGTEEYQNALDLLKVNQNALKDAMYATSASLDDVKASATGVSDTYNGLVHRMAAYKEELRNTDISTEEGKKRFAELAKQINDTNDKLKELDAMQGNFQRNVGNYKSAFEGFPKYMSGITDAMDKGLKSMSGGLGAVKGGFDALSASPAVGTFAILVSAASHLATALKDSEGGTEALQKAMNAFKPVMDFLSGILEKVVGYASELIEKVAEFVTSNGLFDKVIKGVMGVGNAIFQYITAPLKGVLAAIKVFQEEGVKGFRNASKAFGAEMKSGFSFKQNFQAGQAMADAVVKGAKSKKKEVEKSGKETADDWFKGWEKAIADNERKFDERLKSMELLQNELDADVQAETDAVNAELDAYFQSLEDAEERKQIMREYEEEQERIHQEELDEINKNKIDSMYAVANATADILGTIADLYENDSKNAEKNANKIKALRIAESTINTITGAIGAFTQASATIPPPFGQIVGAVSAAAVTAAGIAQIAKIKSTKVSTSGSTSGGSIGATITAPTMTTNVDNVRNVTSASEEDRLNQMASSQKVYILQSDIEASNNQSKVRTAETSF